MEVGEGRNTEKNRDVKDFPARRQKIRGKNGGDKRVEKKKEILTPRGWAMLCESEREKNDRENGFRSRQEDKNSAHFFLFTNATTTAMMTMTIMIRTSFHRQVIFLVP